MEVKQNITKITAPNENWKPGDKIETKGETITLNWEKFSNDERYMAMIGTVVRIKIESIKECIHQSKN